jgi:hypothetical protein
VALAKVEGLTVTQKALSRAVPDLFPDPLLHPLLVRESYHRTMPVMNYRDRYSVLTSVQTDAESSVLIDAIIAHRLVQVAHTFFAKNRMPE